MIAPGAQGWGVGEHWTSREGGLSEPPEGGGEPDRQEERCVGIAGSARNTPFWAECDKKGRTMEYSYNKEKEKKKEGRNKK